MILHVYDAAVKSNTGEVYVATPDQKIVDAVKRIVVEGLSSDQITEDLFSTKLYTNGIPDPDFVIRTAGEMRLSNFLMWQCAYAEFYTTKCWWPDFDEDEASKALDEFSNRNRRYGKLDSI